MSISDPEYGTGMVLRIHLLPNEQRVPYVNVYEANRGVRDDGLSKVFASVQEARAYTLDLELRADVQVIEIRDELTVLVDSKLRNPASSLSW